MFFSCMLKKEKRFLFFLFIISFAVRALFFVFFLSKNNRYIPSVDCAEYKTIAMSVTSGKGFLGHDDKPQFLRVPVYPVFISLCYKFFGNNDIVVMWVQIFLSSLIPIIVFFLSCLLYKSILLAKITSMLISFHLGFILYAGTMLTETLFSFFFMLFLVFFLSSFSLYFFKQKVIFSRYKFLVAGILLGIASLIRPVGHFLLLISMIMILFSSFYFAQKIRALFFIWIGWFFVAGCWLLRNYLLLGSIFFHTLPGIHFLQNTVALVYSDVNKCSGSEGLNYVMNMWQDTIQEEELAQDRLLNEFERCRLGENLTLQFFLKYPAAMMKQFSKNFLRACGEPNSNWLLFIDSWKLPHYSSESGLWDRIKRFIYPDVRNKFLRPIIYIDILSYLLIVIGFVLFLVRTCISLRIHDLYVTAILLPFIGLIFFLTIGGGCARLRLPVEPLMILLAMRYWLVMGGKIKESSHEEKIIDNYSMLQ